MLCVCSVEWLDKNCHSAVLGMTISDPWSWIEAVNRFVLLRPSVVTHLLPQALRRVVFSFFFFPPREPSRGKSVKLEVAEDKRTKGSIFTPRKWQLVCLLTPFPKRSISMFLKKHTSPFQGCWLAGPLWLGLLKAPQKEGLFSDTWQWANSTSDKSSLGHPAVAMATGYISQCRAHMVLLTRQKAERPWKPANRVLEITRATFLELLKQSKTSKCFVKGFSPGWKDPRSCEYFPSLPPWWGLPSIKSVTSLPMLVVRLFSIYLNPSWNIGKKKNTGLVYSEYTLL